MEHMAESAMVNEEKKPTAEELLAIINKARNGELVKEEEILDISKLFKDEFTLDNMQRGQVYLNNIL